MLFKDTVKYADIRRIASSEVSKLRRWIVRSGDDHNKMSDFGARPTQPTLSYPHQFSLTLPTSYLPSLTNWNSPIIAHHSASSQPRSIDALLIKYKANTVGAYMHLAAGHYSTALRHTVMLVLPYNDRSSGCRLYQSQCARRQ